MYIPTRKICTLTVKIFNYHLIYFLCYVKGCKLNGDGANILPDLPSEFECNWKNCNDRFECMQYYAYHVAQHLDYSKFKNSNFICPWTGLLIINISKNCFHQYHLF